MGIFKRVKSIATADIHDTLDKIEDPISMLKQYLREMAKEIQKVQAALSNQLFVEKKYESLIAETTEIIEKRASQAELAVSLNEEEIAKIAIEEKINQENKLKIYQSQLETVKNQTGLLVDQLNQLKEKHEELINRKLTLVSRATVAQTSFNTGQSLVSINPENALKGFLRAEEKILELEAKASANQYLLNTTKVENEKKLDTLLDDQIQKELTKLKEAKMRQA